MAKRDAVVRCIERKTTECYAAFATELTAVKKHFDSCRQNPPAGPCTSPHSQLISSSGVPVTTQLIPLIHFMMLKLS